MLKSDILGQVGPSHPSPNQGSRYEAKDRGSVNSRLQRMSSSQTFCKDHKGTFSTEFLCILLLYACSEHAGTHSLHPAKSQGEEMMRFTPNLKPWPLWCLIMFDKVSWEALTPIQAARHGVTFTRGALKVRSRTVYEGAGSSRLGLCPAAVAELGAQREEFLWRCFW